MIFDVLSVLHAIVVSVAIAAWGSNETNAFRHCRTNELSASVAAQGATGSILGSITVRDVGAAVCALGGRPRLTVWHGRQDLGVAERPARFQTPQTPRVEVLFPGDEAVAFFEWGDYCGRPYRDERFRIRASLTGGAQLAAPLDTPAPPCSTKRRGGGGTLRVDRFSERTP